MKNISWDCKFSRITAYHFLHFFFFAHMSQNACKLTIATGYVAARVKKKKWGREWTKEKQVTRWAQCSIYTRWLHTTEFSPAFSLSCFCNTLRKLQMRCIAIWLAYTKKPSNARTLGLRARRQIHSLGSLAFRKIAHKDRWKRLVICSTSDTPCSVCDRRLLSAL